MSHLEPGCFIKTSLPLPPSPSGENWSSLFSHTPCHLESGNVALFFCLPAAKMKLFIFLPTPICSPGFLSPANSRNIHQVVQVKTLAVSLDLVSYQHPVHQEIYQFYLKNISQPHLIFLHLHHRCYNPSHVNHLLIPFSTYIPFSGLCPHNGNLPSKWLGYHNSLLLKNHKSFISYLINPCMIWALPTSGFSSSIASSIVHCSG